MGANSLRWIEMKKIIALVPLVGFCLIVYSEQLYFKHISLYDLAKQGILDWKIYLGTALMFVPPVAILILSCIKRPKGSNGHVFRAEKVD